MKPIADLPHTLRRFAFRRRRPLAAMLAFLAVVVGLSSVQSDAGGSTVVVTTHEVGVGKVLSATDLTTVEWTAHVPSGTSADVDDFIGERTAAPMGAGEALTPLRIIGPKLLHSYGPDSLATTVRIADGAALTGLRSGDPIAIIGTAAESGKAAVISRDIHLLSEPPTSEDQSDRGVSIQVVASEADALKLAAVSLDSRLTLVAISPERNH